MPLLATKTKNRIARAFGGDLEFSLRNTTVNGRKRGCSGFITNPANGTTVYIDTEQSCTGIGMLYRYADGPGDFLGGRNQWAKTGERLFSAVAECLAHPGTYNSIY